MKKIISVLAVFLLFIVSANAQFGMKKLTEEASEIKTKKLLVILADEKDVENATVFNESVKKAIEKDWTFNTEYQFVSMDQVESIRNDKKNRSEYAYLSYSPFAVINNFPENAFRIGLLDKIKCTYFQTVDFESDMSEADVIFTLQRIQDYIKGLSEYSSMSKKEMMAAYKDSGKLAASIKDKTLLIDDRLVDDKIKKLLEFKYKHNYKIVNKSEIDQAIVSKQKDVAYIKAIIQSSAPTTKTEYTTELKDGSPNVIRRDGLTQTKGIFTRKGSSVDAIIHSVYDANSGQVLYVFDLPKSKVKLGPINNKFNIDDFEELIKVVN